MAAILKRQPSHQRRAQLTGEMSVLTKEGEDMEVASAFLPPTLRGAATGLHQ